MPPETRCCDLSISIVNINGRDLLGNCLQSIYRATSLINFNIYVVDNASTDGSIEMVLQEFPDVQLIQTDRILPFSINHNLVLRKAEGRYILLLNNDAVVLEGTLDRLVEFLDEHPDGAIVGPMELDAAGKFHSSYGKFPTLLSQLILLSGLSSWVYGPYYPSHSPEESQETRSVDWVGGACLMVRREAMRQVGLLDEELRLYGEETDWCYRMKQAGWKVYYCPEAKFLHWGAQTTDRVIGVNRWLYLCQSKLHFFKKHYRKSSAPALRVMIFLFAFLRSLACLTMSLLPGSTKKLEMRQLAQVFWTTALLRSNTL